MRSSIENEFIMLCEGAAENACFRELIRIHRLPNFDFPFPPEERVNGDTRALHGRDGFVNMLNDLNSYFSLFPDKRRSVRGIVIAITHS
jgi:hypothetical protein